MQPLNQSAHALWHLPSPHPILRHAQFRRLHVPHYQAAKRILPHCLCSFHLATSAYPRCPRRQSCTLPARHGHRSKICADHRGCHRQLSLTDQLHNIEVLDLDTARPWRIVSRFFPQWWHTTTPTSNPKKQHMCLATVKNRGAHIPSLSCGSCAIAATPSFPSNSHLFCKLNTVLHIYAPLNRPQWTTSLGLQLGAPGAHSM